MAQPPAQNQELSSHYDPKAVEARLYDFWEKNGVFAADTQSNLPKYCIIMPPPNVTGVLHMGHALMCTVEDVLIRWKRMAGFNALWLPGTDHAGIATQMVVERNLLKEEKVSKHDLGREEFLKRVWAWKEQSQTTILSQMRLIGCSADWSRLTFTLDDNVSEAVRECFVRLFKDGLIYREQSIIQWCPRCRTALSDLEVKFKESKGKIWHIRYVLASDRKRSLTVATTRPETLLGDTAVAVHPDDERFKDFQGQEVLVPLVDRPVKVIADEYVDKEFGTGALKITPGHDPNDYLVGKKHGLKVLSIFDETAAVNEAGGKYKGLPRDKARETILADLQAAGLLVQEVDHVNNVGHCDRCSTVVEPRVSLQWFVNAEVLAKDAIRAVESKEIQILPVEWEKTYFEWMRNIRPWCISRQLWWGHRIPVWYCGDCAEVMAAVQAPRECSQCKSTKLTQDEDVLDTWFSSGLWPISTLGWPKDTADLKKFYPTDVMETGFDILFFWVARMIMLGMRMTGKIPFHTIYLHPMVRDEYGQKMSKTKGNVIDPLEIIREMGADSLRFFFASNCFHGRDVRVSDSQIEASRNFVTKIWNAARFVQMRFSSLGAVAENDVDWDNPINQWIWTSLDDTKRAVTTALEQYRLYDAADKLYHFLWDTYCFWFIEFLKAEGEIERRLQKRDATAVLVLEEVLRLMHPIMPFLSEEIWQKMPYRAGSSTSIARAPYPKPGSRAVYRETFETVERVGKVIESVRTSRGVAGLAPGKEISLLLSSAEGIASLRGLEPYLDLIKKLARVSKIELVATEPSPNGFAVSVLGAMKLFIPQSELGDVEELAARKRKELREKEDALKRADAKLLNEKFMAGAPEAVRAGVIKQRDELLKEVTALKQSLGEA